MEYDIARRAFAELVGAFALIFVGVGSIAAPASPSQAWSASRLRTG